MLLRPIFVPIWPMRHHHLVLRTSKLHQSRKAVAAGCQHAILGLRKVAGQQLGSLGEDLRVETSLFSCSTLSCFNSLKSV